jgi:hypothetical protein
MIEKRPNFLSFHFLGLEELSGISFILTINRFSIYIYQHRYLASFTEMNSLKVMSSLYIILFYIFFFVNSVFDVRATN